MMPLADYDNLAAVRGLVEDAIAARRGDAGFKEPSNGFKEPSNGPQQIEDDVMRKIAPGTALFTMAAMHARNIARGILEAEKDAV